MADPPSIAMASMGVSAAGGVMGAVGSIFGDESKASMYEYQSGIATMNERIAKQNADWTRQAGEVLAQESGMKTRAEIGMTAAVQGAHNLDVNKGSTVAVRQSEAEVGQQNEAIIRSNAAHKAYGFGVEAANYEAQANIDKMAASQSRTAGYIGAASSLLGSSASVANKWLQYGPEFGSGGGGGNSAAPANAFLGGIY